MNERVDQPVNSETGADPWARLRQLALGVCVGGLFLALALRQATWGNVVERLADISWGPYLLGVGCYALFLVVKTLRWRLLLAQVAIQRPMLPITRATVWGVAANALIPHSGEVLRSIATRKPLGATSTSIFGTIASERVFDLFTVILVAASTIFFYSESSNLLVTTIASLSVMGAILLTACLVLILNEQLLELVIRIMGKVLPAKATKAISWQLTELAKGIRQSLATGHTPSVFALSLIQWIMITACIHFSLAATGIDVPLVAAIVILPITIAGTTLPTAPAYLGTIQICFLVGLGLFGVSDDSAIAASFVYIGIVTLPVLLVSGVWAAASAGASVLAGTRKAD